MSLKYYREEAIRCWRFTGQCLSHERAISFTKELIDRIGLPQIGVDCKLRGSSSGMYYMYKHISYNKSHSCSVLTAIHETAHYWDHYNREREINQRFGNRPRSAEDLEIISQIRNKHYHGKSHKNYVDLLCAMVADHYPDYVVQGPVEECIYTCVSRYKENRVDPKVEMLYKTKRIIADQIAF